MNDNTKTLSTITFGGNYASITRRLAAVFIDALLLAIPGLFIGGLSYGIGALFVYFIYAPVFESSALKATPGKHLMGIQVTDLRGDRLTFMSALIRNAVKSASAVFLFIPWFFALFTQNRQAVHDMLANTLVVYGRADLPVFAAYMDNARELLKGTPLVSGDSSKLTALERLQSLYEKGALTREEFEREKNKIIGA